MLSGIKTGKRKRNKAAPSSGGGSAERVSSSDARGTAATRTEASSSNNASIAEQLRQQLASGTAAAPPPKIKSTEPKYKSSELALDRLQRRGRIHQTSKGEAENDKKDVVMLTGSAAASDRPDYRTGKFFYTCSPSMTVFFVFAFAKECNTPFYLQRTSVTGHARAN